MGRRLGGRQGAGHRQVIRKFWRATKRSLTSSGLVAGLLGFIVVWSIIATAVPQGVSRSTVISEWASAHPVLEAVVRALGMHQAFGSILFLAVVGVLGLSTALCSWQRTKVAMARSRLMRTAKDLGAEDLGAAHDIAIEPGTALAGPEILTIAADVLARLGIKVRERDGVLRAVSQGWSVWSSAVFHWSLLALMCVVLVGFLGRSDGMMAVAVGQTKADAPSSYGVLSAGPLHDWSKIHRALRVDALDESYQAGGMDRGAVPTVSVLDASGNVIKTQPVYPNMMLHVGSVSVNAPAFGLTVELSLEDTSGANLGTVVEPIDFVQGTPEGTTAVKELMIRRSDTRTNLRVQVTVPLDRRGSTFIESMPQNPSAHVVVRDSDGAVLADQTLQPDDAMDVPGGQRLKLLSVGWYSRLAIVDDWTTPLLYAVMVIGLLALAAVAVMRQQIVLASVVNGPEGARLVLRCRLWRNVPTTRSEMESALSDALGAPRSDTSPVSEALAGDQDKESRS